MKLENINKAESLIAERKKMIIFKDRLFEMHSEKVNDIEISTSVAAANFKTPSIGKYEGSFIEFIIKSLLEDTNNAIKVIDDMIKEL